MEHTASFLSRFFVASPSTGLGNGAALLWDRTGQVTITIFTRASFCLDEIPPPGQETKLLRLQFVTPPPPTKKGKDIF